MINILSASVVLTWCAATLEVIPSTGKPMAQEMYGILITMSEFTLIDILECVSTLARCCWHQLCEICTAQNRTTHHLARTRDAFR